MGYITLNKKAFFNNASYYLSLIGDKNKLCMALKDNAYGHGIDEMAQFCLEFGIKHCIVRDIREANIASKYGFETILILYEIPTKNYPNNYIFSINSLESINSYPNNTKVELKIDTAMSRNGILDNEIDEVVQLIKTKQLILNGIFTHFCCADEDNDTTTKQEQKFTQAIKYIKKQISIPFRIHCANSAGVHKVDNSIYDMVRLGIGMYGYSLACQKSLQPVLSLWANKISTRVLPKNSCVGYGATYKTTQDTTTISNYDIGYGDGFFRLNERKKAKVKNGKSILGRVSMDSFSLEGDEDKVCIFDDVTHLALVHDTIDYEILTHLQPHIKRIVL